MSSNVPQARQILRMVARQLRTGLISKAAAARHISKTLPMLERKSPVRRAPPARYLTKRVKAQIVEYARQYPEAQLSDIAEWFKVNQGRVSEVLNGKR